ncbi:MAG: hypothetical protein JO218_00715 [Burkholderiales bacterium]|nr:hypothetical protein [Burkholderiales bacterium]
MALGDKQDMLARLQAVLPPWFGDGGPVVGALLNGLAQAAAFVYAQIAYVRLQLRIATATDDNLDVIAADFFGNGLPRRLGQWDASYRTTIKANLFQERATRHAVANVLQGVTGNVPVIFEPGRPADFGAYGAGGYGIGAYGFGNGAGLQYQAFVHAYRAPMAGGPVGYGVPAAGYGGGGAAYGASPNVYDLDIYAAVEAVRPIGTQVWVGISN